MSKYTLKQKARHTLATINDFRYKGSLILDKQFYVKSDTQSKDLYAHKTHAKIDIKSFKELIGNNLIFIDNET